MMYRYILGRDIYPDISLSGETYTLPSPRMGILKQNVVMENWFFENGILKMGI